MNSFKIECNENVDNYYNDVVVNGCHNDIILSNDNIYEIDGIDYFGETIEKYYTICPNCGYMVFINSDGLDESIKKNAKDKNSKQMYLFAKNKLKSEYIHLNYLERNMGKRRVLK
jgi:hypothetical protein